MFHQSEANEGSTNTAHKGAFCLDFIQRLFVIFIFLLEMVIVYLLTFHPNVARLSFGRKIVKHSIKLTWFEKVSIPWVIARRYSFKIHLCAALNNINPKKSPTTNQGTIQASLTSKSYKSIRPKNIQTVQLPKTSNFYDEPSKGQLISKANCQAVNSSKKRTN